MCRKNKQDNDNEDKRSDSLVKVAICTITIIFSLTMAFLVLWQLLNKSCNVREVSIELSVPTDSVLVETVLAENENQIKRLITELDRQSQEITEKYDLLLKSQETESDFYRLVSCIAAFVVALMGFLGYRTIKDIEEKAKSLAGEKADKTAKEYVANHLESEVEKQLKEIIGDTTAAKLIREQIMNELNPRIGDLETRINTLKSGRQETEQDYSEKDDSSVNKAFIFDEKEINKLTDNAQQE